MVTGVCVCVRYADMRFIRDTASFRGVGAHWPRSEDGSTIGRPRVCAVSRHLRVRLSSAPADRPMVLRVAHR